MVCRECHQTSPTAADGYNGHTTRNLVQLVCLDEDDIELLDDPAADGPVDPGDLMGDTISLMPQDMRALAKALLAAADAVEVKNGATIAEA